MTRRDITIRRGLLVPQLSIAFVDVVVVAILERDCTLRQRTTVVWCSLEHGSVAKVMLLDLQQLAYYISRRCRLCGDAR